MSSLFTLLNSHLWKYNPRSPRRTEEEKLWCFIKSLEDFQASGRRSDNDMLITRRRRRSAGVNVNPGRPQVERQRPESGPDVALMGTGRLQAGLDTGRTGRTGRQSRHARLRKSQKSVFLLFWQPEVGFVLNQSWIVANSCVRRRLASLRMSEGLRTIRQRWFWKTGTAGWEFLFPPLKSWFTGLSFRSKNGKAALFTWRPGLNECFQNENKFRIK